MLFRYSVSSAVTLAVLTLAFTACQQEDPRVSGLGAGMIKDSVIAAMGAPDASPKSYLAGGQFIEILMFRSDGDTGPIEGLGRESILPIVIVDGVLTGWGWPHWDSVAESHSIPVDPAR